MGFLSNLFGGGKNPSDSAMQYLQQIPGRTQQYQQPYFNAGVQALPQLQQQYGSLLGNPGGKLNEIGQNYQQSPGLDFAIQQALQGAGHAAAAGGMAGSPEHEQQNMSLATNLANQDYNNWLGQATGLYGQGLSGEQNLAGMGQQSGNSMADMIAQALASQAGYSYAGQAAKNQQHSGLLGNIGRGIGALSAFTPWGQAGHAIGGFLGGQ
jgi:hypothetical protein